MDNLYFERLIRSSQTTYIKRLTLVKNSLETIKFDKAECGVDILLNVGYGCSHKNLYGDNLSYRADCFEILFFREGKGSLILNQKKIPIVNNTVVFISPFQKRQWNLDIENSKFVFLYFQEDFLNDFFADKLFTYKLLYFYQLHYPLNITISGPEMQLAYDILGEIKYELENMSFGSEHIIRSLLYYLLLKLDRNYAQQLNIPLNRPSNNYAFQFKKMLETNICQRQRIEDYTAELGISRITLNKAVQAQFNVTATHLIKQRLLFEIKNELIHSDLTVSEIAYKLNFSEPNHLMRFFKAQTGLTTTLFIEDYQNGSF